MFENWLLQFKIIKGLKSKWSWELQNSWKEWQGDEKFHGFKELH